MAWSAEEFTKLINRGSGVSVANGLDLSPAPSNTAAARIENLEYCMQSVVFERCAMLAALYAEYALVFAVPNDMVRPGQRMTAGLKAGVPDIFWPVARGGYHGMFIELKVGRNPLQQKQQQWIDRLEMEGFFCVVVRNDPEAVIAEMESYRKLNV
jgi:hypothetical protein